MPPMRRTVPLVLAVVVHVVVLYAPRLPSTGASGLPGIDKVGHVAVFALVALVALWAGLSPRLVIPVLLGHAVLSEVVQHVALPGRSGDPWDSVADVAGLALGWAVWRWWAARITTRRGDDEQEPSGPGR